MVLKHSETAVRRTCKRMFVVLGASAICFLSSCSSIPADDAPSTLMRLNGGARVSEDGGKSWTRVNVGDLIKSGSLVQTAGDSAAFIVLGKHINPVPRTPRSGGLFNPDEYAHNLIGLHQNTLVRLEMPSPSNASPVPAKLIKLELKDGRLQADARALGANLILELECGTNALVRTQGAIFFVSASGRLSVFDGGATVTLNGGEIREVAAGYKIDESGSMTNLPPLDGDWKHDLWLPSDPIYIGWSPHPDKMRTNWKFKASPRKALFP